MAQINNGATLCDTRAIGQVIGCLIQKPELLNETQKYNLNNNDFPERFHKILFASISNLFNSGVTSIDNIVIDNFLSQHEVQYNIYNDNNGLEYIDKIIEISNVENFEMNFDRVKKFSLLRDYQRIGVDIRHIYDVNEFEPNKLQDMQEAFNSASIKDIVDSIEARTIEVKEKYVVAYGSHGQQAGENLDELIQSLKDSPAMGAPLLSPMLSTLTRGARLKKLYMRSAPTGVGKTRLSLADACCLSMLGKYDSDTGKWVRGHFLPTLFITTELEMEEIQTMILSYVADIDEDKILDSNYTKEELERIHIASKIIQESSLWIEHIPNFDVDDIESTIQRYILKRNVHYVFFDYIHTTVRMLTEIASQSRGVALREDNILLMFVDRLKNLCNLYDVFIMTATQVNGEYKNAKDADQNLLRGAKSLADKLDVGIIALNPTREDIEALKPILEDQFGLEPNMVLHLYKNRRGKHVAVKLWQHVDLGTMKITDLFLTDNDYKVVPLEIVDILINDDEDERPLDVERFNIEI